MANKHKIDYTSENNARWLLNYIDEYIGTDSAKAMEDVLKALIRAGQTTAALGVLDHDNSAMLRAVIADQKALDIASRAYWWGESTETASRKSDRQNKFN